MKVCLLLSVSFCLLWPITAYSQDSVTVRYSRQPKVVLDTVAGTKATKLSVWQATACNFSQSNYPMSPELITFLAATKISVTDLALTQAVIDRAKRNTVAYRTTDQTTKILSIAGAVIPSLQAAQIIQGSPWISGGVAAASIVLPILVKHKEEISLSQLPGNWNGSRDLRPRECGVWLFLGEYNPKMSAFEVTAPQAARQVSFNEPEFRRPEWPEPTRRQPSFD